MAAAFLIRRGMRVLDRRFRCRIGEIDVVADHCGTVVFVEVKTRRRGGSSRPADSVTPLKQRRMSRVALFYLQRKGWLNRNVRFDVVEVEVDEDGAVSLHHIPGAFSPG